jgi:hypothetical protein
MDVGFRAFPLQWPSDPAPSCMGGYWVWVGVGGGGEQGRYTFIMYRRRILCTCSPHHTHTALSTEAEFSDEIQTKI